MECREVPAAQGQLHAWLTHGPGRGMAQHPLQQSRLTPFAACATHAHRCPGLSSRCPGLSSRPCVCAPPHPPDSGFPDRMRTPCHNGSLAEHSFGYRAKRFGDCTKRVGSNYEVGRRRGAGHSASETPRLCGPSRRGVSAIFSVVSIVSLLSVLAGRLMWAGPALLLDGWWRRCRRLDSWQTAPPIRF